MAEPVSLPTQVLAMCTELSRRRMGGPGVMMELLQKEYDEAKPSNLTMVTVFRDKWFRTYTDLEAEAKRPVNDRFRPGALGYWGQAAGSRLRFLANVRAAMQGHYTGRVFHCHDFVSSYLVRRVLGRRYPIIQTVHAKGGAVREAIQEDPRLKGSLWERVARHVEWTSVRRAEVVAFTSKGSRALFEDAHPGLLDGKDVRVVHAGVDLGELDAIPDNPGILGQYGIPDGAFLLVTVAALVPDKGLDTLVEAIAALPEELRKRVRSLIVGRDGPLRDKLEAMIKGNGLQENVRLLGFLPRQDLVQLMRRASLFVLTPGVSVFDHVLLEVGALGTPVVTTAVGGNLEMFEGGSAFLVPPADRQALAETLTRALTDEGLRQRTGAKAKERVRGQFSVQALFRAYQALYAEVGGKFRARVVDSKGTKGK